MNALCTPDRIHVGLCGDSFCCRSFSLLDGDKDSLDDLMKEIRDIKDDKDDETSYVCYQCQILADLGEKLNSDENFLLLATLIKLLVINNS